MDTSDATRMKLPGELERAIADPESAARLVERAKAAARTGAVRQGGDPFDELVSQFATNPDDLGRMIESADEELAGGTSWTLTITTVTTAPATLLTTAVCALGATTVVTMTTATLETEPEVRPEGPS